jgi:hypothetical protein
MNRPIGNIYLGRRFTVEEIASHQRGGSDFQAMIYNAWLDWSSKPAKETKAELYARLFGEE